MSNNSLRRALWICDYFPRPHDMSSGTWALENTIALQAAGLPTAVLSPTPWIPRFLATTDELRNWSQVPDYLELRGVPVYYPRCPHYPRAWVHNKIYARVPFLDSKLLWPWCKATVDTIMERHPFDVVHTNFMYPAGYLGLKLKQRYGTPFVFHERSIQRMALARQHAARGRMYRHVLRNADLVVTENSRMAAELRDMEPGIPACEVVVQPGTHPETVESAKRPRPPEFEGKLVVSSCGALSERKGHKILIEAIAEVRKQFPNVVCRIIGDGPEHGRLAALIDQLNLTGVVELRGKQLHSEVLADMSWCDIFVLASWGEASGTVYGEAMQFNKPVIACSDEGISEVVNDREHGRLVPAGDVGALAEAISWLLEDETRRASIGARARELANSDLSYPHVARRLINYYRAMIDGARTGRGGDPDMAGRSSDHGTRNRP